MATSTYTPTLVKMKNAIFGNATEHSGEYDNENYSMDAPLSFDCDVWSKPSRVAMQAILLIMMLLNIAAAVVVFGVPVNIRGRHVSFLFICVRALNILDLYQCVVIFFFPLGMPPDCQNPNIIYCNISGFCLATATTLSPLVAIVMALDRFFAVFFHVRYKAKPQTKLKCAVLACVVGIYALYFTLPFYTDFGKYIPAPWLSVCGYEPGVEYRMFNLVLSLSTAVLTLVLLVTNVAILIKVRQRQKEFERLKSSSQLAPTRRGSKRKKLTSQMKINGVQLSKSKSLDDVNMSSTPTPRSSNSLKSLHERRGKAISPLSIIFSPYREKNCEADVGQLHHGPISTENDKKNSDNLESQKYSHIPRPFSPIPPSPLTHDSTLLFPPSPSPPKRHSAEVFRPPSPLALNDRGADKLSPRIVTKLPLSVKNSVSTRLSSADSVADGKEYQVTAFSHRLNDPNSLRKKALGNISTTKRNASSEPILDQSFTSRSDDENRNKSPSTESSMTNSLFSTFVSNRLMSWRAHLSRPSGVRRNVSRITKMTTAICCLFAVLYVPYIIRKLVQVIPYEYVEVPRAVMIVTLFGPLLSPLCNPILYVFFNPHYRENCKRLYRKVMRGLKGRSASGDFDVVVSRSLDKRSLRSRSKRRRNKRSKKGANEMNNRGLRAEPIRSADDVFLSPAKKRHVDGVSISDTAFYHSKDNYDGSSDPESPPPATLHDDSRRRQSLRQLHLRRIQNLQYRRANSEYFLN